VNREPCPPSLQSEGLLLLRLYFCPTQLLAARSPVKLNTPGWGVRDSGVPML
jgi:hypothetical protein